MENRQSSSELASGEASTVLTEPNPLEKAYKIMDSVFPEMDLAELDGFIISVRDTLSAFHSTFGRGHKEYGQLNLRLALLLITRFIKERRPDDLAEAKDLETIILRHNCPRDEQDHIAWRLYRSFVDMADVIQEVQRLDALLKARGIQPAQETQGLSIPRHPSISFPPDTNKPEALIDLEATLAELKVSPFLSLEGPINPEIMIARATKELYTADTSCDLELYATYCQVLASGHFGRFQRAKDSHDLEEALDYQTTAFYLFTNLRTLGEQNRLIPQAMVILFAYLSKLGFLDWRDITPTTLPRVDALELLGELIPFIPGRTESTRIWYLLLGKAYFHHHQASGDPAHAEAAITHYLNSSKASAACENVNNRWFQRHLRTNLGILFTNRYSRHSDSNDLDAAIENFRAVDEPGDSERSAWLGMLYQTRYLRHGRRKEDKELGIFYSKNAIELAPQEVPLAVTIGASRFLLACFRLEGNIADLDTVFDLLHGVVDSDTTDRTSSDFSQIGLALAEAYQLRWLITPDDKLQNQSHAYSWYKEAARAARTALVSFEGHPGAAPSPMREWKAAAQSVPSGGHPGAAQSSMREWKATAQALLVTPLSRHEAAVRWGEMALERDLPECLDAFKIAISSLSDRVWIGNTLEDKHSLLEGYSVVPAAVAAALKFGKASLAVEHLEQGLSVTYRQLLQLRDDVGDLAKEHPELAGRLNALSDRLSQLSVGRTEAFDELGVRIGTENYQLGTEYNNLVAKIRTKPGFEDLFLPLPYAKLAIASQYGPVIMISCDRVTESTNALIILNPHIEEPVSLPLPQASLKDLRALNSKLVDVLGRFNISQRTSSDHEYNRAGGPSPWGKDIRVLEFEGILKELWTRIVDPVFKELIKNNIKSGRVWWCLSDYLARLPLHAAAPIDCPYTSSYTYTLGALIDAHKRALASHNAETIHISAIGMSVFPGRPSLSLPCVRKEMQTLSEVVHGHSTVRLTKVEGGDARIETVLAALKSSQLVHLACHGFQHIERPLDSHFILSDGCLELRRILMEALKSAEFAFLSACQTATGDEKLANESVHLAGGFMAAGFKGVIGTLWSIVDEDAPMVAEEVYGAMITAEGLDITKAAEGLQRAVRKMREAGIPPHRWVPFIHIGI